MSERRSLAHPTEVPHPIATGLPATYHQEDELVLQLTAGLDQVLAPLFLVLDSLDAYFDPALAPDDFVDWLGTWVGVDLDTNWPIPDRREIVARIARIHRRRGTAAGLRDLIRLVFGIDPVVEDSGGVSASPTPQSELPGVAEPSLVVRLPVGPAVDVRELEAMVRAARPAHVPLRVEVGGT